MHIICKRKYKSMYLFSFLVIYLFFHIYWIFFSLISLKNNTINYLMFFIFILMRNLCLSKHINTLRHDYILKLSIRGICILEKKYLQAEQITIKLHVFI